MLSRAFVAYEREHIQPATDNSLPAVEEYPGRIDLLATLNISIRATGTETILGSLYLRPCALRHQHKRTNCGHHNRSSKSSAKFVACMRAFGGRCDNHAPDMEQLVRFSGNQPLHRNTHVSLLASQISFGQKDSGDLLISSSLLGCSWSL